MLPIPLTLNKHGWQTLQRIFQSHAFKDLTPLAGDELLTAIMMAELALPAYKKITIALRKLHDGKTARLTITRGQASMLAFFQYNVPADDKYATVTLLTVTDIIQKAILQPAIG